MRLRWLPLLTGLLPIVAIHLSLLVAIDARVIPPCFPYLDGCASISATGRYEPASFVFKPAMMSEWAIMVCYWLLNVAWLRALAGRAEKTGPVGTAMAAIGTTGAIALILYITFLGTQAPFYEFMRRIGIYFYFGGTVIAQILLARHTLWWSRALGLRRLRLIGRSQMVLALVPFALGALNFVLKSTLADSDPAENVIEWFVALLMHVCFLLSYAAWRDTGFGGRWVVAIDDDRGGPDVRAGQNQALDAAAAMPSASSSSPSGATE